jgi:hypothetical protein
MNRDEHAIRVDDDLLNRKTDWKQGQQRIGHGEEDFLWEKPFPFMWLSSSSTTLALHRECGWTVKIPAPLANRLLDAACFPA